MIAFDSSPLTGFRDLPEEVRTGNSKGIQIERVYEQGEILAYLRGPLRAFVPLDDKDPSIIEVRFDLSKGLAVKEHDMLYLARRLREVAG